MGKTGNVVEMKSKEQLKAEAQNGANNPVDNGGTTGEEKLSFWKHPFKVTKKVTAGFNEKHPKVKWILGGVTAVVTATVVAFATGLLGGKKDDGNDDTIEVWTSDEDSTEEDDAEVDDET
jgi:flagellar basal body-associated protein FliL